MPHDLVKFLDTSAALEATAAVEHERWAHWQKYLHGQCTVLEDGSLLIPSGLVERWELQISTPYAALTEREKDSDREQAQLYLEALRNAARNEVS